MATFFIIPFTILILCLKIHAFDPVSSFSFNDFGKDPNFKSVLGFYGNAKVVNGGSEVLLSGYGDSGNGKVMYKKPIRVVDVEDEPKFLVSFSSYFEFSLSFGDGNGLAFVMVPKGFEGEVFGNGSFGLKEKESKVVAVEFIASRDVRNKSSDSFGMAIDVGGSVPVKRINVSSVNMVIRNGGKLHAWIDYDSNSRRLEVRLSRYGHSKPVNPLLWQSVDLSYNWTTEEIFAGFSSMKGKTSQACFLYSWSFDVRHFRHFMHSEPMDTKAYYAKNTYSPPADKPRSDCVLRILAAMIFGSGCGALAAFTVLYLWTMFGNRRPVVPEECVMQPVDCEYKKVNIVVDKPLKDDTCLEGLQGLEGTFAKVDVSSGLDHVMSLVKKNLFEVVLSNDQFATATDEDRFPSWINDEDKFLEANETTADAIVAADGSGNYTTVMDAVLAAPKFSMKRYVIYVKKGVYVENVEIDRKKWNIMMIGEGMDATIISGSRNRVDGWTTFRSATFAVNGRGFIACNISFKNTAGPEKEQAVALRSDSDLSVFYRCGIFGYQDSLYTHTQRQFYKACKITGTVDFIFGNGTVMFQDCEILAKKGKPGQKNTVTAHGRTDPNTTTGFSFQFCNISADFDLLPFIATMPTYLGRPWRPYSRTIFMQSHMSNAISPEGWLEYNGSVGLDTLYYSEYMNSGPGAGVANRVKWSGYHVMNDSSEAEKFTVAQFILGDLWLPSAGVTYTAGLTV